jgi:hypothetical protein
MWLFACVVKATDENLTSENWEFIMVCLSQPMFDAATGRMTLNCDLRPERGGERDSR